MNGPEHYAEAEALLRGHNEMTTAERFAAAQVHATLARTAVLAAALRNDLPTGQVDQWVRAGVL